jgi:hypothetical protein
MNAENFCRAARIGVGLILLALSTGCSNFPNWGAGAHRPSNEEIAAVLARTENQMYAQDSEIQQRPTVVVATTTTRQ